MNAPVLTSKGALLVGGWLALTAMLAGVSGIAGEIASPVLLVLGIVVVLVLPRGPKGS